MANTIFFVQCKDCENCSLHSFGHFCDKHIHDIDNPECDGCTWGDEKEKNSDLLYADMEEIIDA